MKHLLLFATLLLIAAPAWAQTKDPTMWRFTGNPYRHRLTVVDSSSRVFLKANTAGIRTKLAPKQAFEQALTILRNNGYVLAFSNPDSLLFGTRPKAMPVYAARTVGCGIWGRVLPNGTILFYPFYFNDGIGFVTWAGDGRVDYFRGTFAFDVFHEAEIAARSYTDGQFIYYRMKP